MVQKELKLEVSKDFISKRLDLFVCKSLDKLNRTYVQKLIKNKHILVNNKTVKSGYKLKSNDKVFVKLPALEETKIKSEKIKLNVVYEDKDLIVIDKPQGMVTHPAPGVYKGTLVNALLSYCGNSLSGINGVLRPGIVHRLDKETSGLILVCKNDKAHNEIVKQIQSRKLKRQYLAILHGKVQHDIGKINKPIGRDKIHRHKMTVVSGGRNSITNWKVLKRFEKYTFIECALETGRTHQIRVHMKSIGHPVVGDATYGKRNDSNKMMLHACRLVFKHPFKKTEIKLETKVPERFQEFLRVL